MLSIRVRFVLTQWLDGSRRASICSFRPRKSSSVLQALHVRDRHTRIVRLALGSHSPRRAYLTPALRAACCLPTAPVVPDDDANLPRIRNHGVDPSVPQP
ncbi:hypothetical protein B0H13DRAFT_2326530 [Mycena leptocephala]|nr:hypothetical protein B0H13DRAFT_2326530 [Mycena leptocephala]